MQIGMLTKSKQSTLLSPPSAPSAGSRWRRCGGVSGLQSEKLLEVINVLGATKRPFLIATKNSFWTTSALVVGRQ